MPKRDKNVSSLDGHGTYIRRELMSSDAYRAISAKAQVLYVWLRLEFKGNRFNNNGKIRLSYRQAAFRLGVSVNTAMRAFHELQAKGFIIVTQLGSLGVDGMARCPTYELTDLPTVKLPPKFLYRVWKPGSDFEVQRHRRNTA